MLIDTIRQDLTAAMKARDEVRLRSLRAVLTAVSEAEKAGTEAKELTDAEVQAIITAQVKRRVEAAEAFDDGGRPERAEGERAEKAVLETYLPAALSPEELTELVDRMLGEGGWRSNADMGTAMKAINAEVAGRADGRTVAELVKARLA